MIYASKYYDPVKAHEYYENYTKKGLLKGRQKSQLTKLDTVARSNTAVNRSTDSDRSMSTKGFSESQKAAFKQAKQRIAEARSQALQSVSNSISSQSEAISKDISTKSDSINRALKTKLRDITTQQNSKMLAERAGLRQKTSEVSVSAKEEVTRRNEQVTSQIAAMRNQMESQMNQLKNLSYAERRQKVDQYSAMINRIRVKAGLENTKTYETASRKNADLIQASTERQTHIKDRHTNKAEREKQSAQKKKESLKAQAANRKSNLRSSAASQRESVKKRYDDEVYREYQKIKGSKR